MKKDFLKRLLPYLLPVVLFILVSVAYLAPDVFEGKQLYQSDMMQFKGSAKEIVDYREQYNKEPLWTNSMFGGMPAYLISTVYKGNKVKFFHGIFGLYGLVPISYIFIYLIGFYIALLLFRVNPWLAFAGAIAYAFSSYFFIIIEVGHIAKVWALGYMPPIIAGVYVALKEKRYLIGSAVTGLFLALQLSINHLQITYYTMLMILILGAFELVSAIRNKQIVPYLKAVAVLVFAVILAISSHFSALWTTYEYGKYSMRGKSELTSNAENKTGGLDKDYATQWSVGIDESLSLLIPNIKGAPGAFNENSKSYDMLKRSQGDANAKKYIRQLPSYWGPQLFTTPVYAGAVVIFLFVFGLFLIKGNLKWWLLTVTVISIVLAWGKHMPNLTDFMFNHFPGYNKFRSVSMTLIMAEFTMPLLGILAIKEIMNKEFDRKQLFMYLKYSLYFVGGMALFFTLFPGVFSLENAADEQYGQLASAFADDRKRLVRVDAFRALVFVLLSFGLLYMFIYKKIKPAHLIGGLIALFLLDMWPVDKRYLNSESFVTKKEEKNTFKPSTADLLIINDKDPNFRVLNLTVNPFQDGTTSFFHHSIGGYHGAKMKRYQELIDYHISPEINELITVFNSQPSSAAIDSVLNQLNVLNILNTRYIIYNREAPPLVNNSELGNAWFVSSYRIVENADEEIAALNSFNPSTEAIVDKRFRAELEGFNPVADSGASISLVKYEPNNLVYRSKTNSEQLVVFSEIHYDKGWNAFIDGQPAKYFRVDYALRAMRIPSGEHSIEFKFHPVSFYTGEKIAMAGSILLILLFIGSLYFEIKKNKTPVVE